MHMHTIWIIDDV